MKDWYIKITDENREDVKSYFNRMPDYEHKVHGWVYANTYVYGMRNGVPTAGTVRDTEITYDQFKSEILGTEAGITNTYLIY